MQEELFPNFLSIALDDDHRIIILLILSGQYRYLTVHLISIAVTKYFRESDGRKIYFGSWFQWSQWLVTCLHCFRFVTRQNTKAELYGV
jgi:hypothetical protein